LKIFLFGPLDPIVPKALGQTKEVKNGSIMLKFGNNCRLDEYLGIAILIFENLSF